MDALIIEEKKGANYILLEISGVINSYTFAEFRSKVYTYIRQSNLVLDLSEVTGIDSSGLGVLMGAFNDGEESGFTLYLMRPSAAAHVPRSPHEAASFGAQCARTLAQDSVVALMQTASTAPTAKAVSAAHHAGSPSTASATTSTAIGSMESSGSIQATPSTAMRLQWRTGI